jgi:hypothetical protein
MRRIRSHLTYSNVMVTILAFIVLGGGSAVALGGHDTVQSDDLGPGAQVKAPDVADNAVDSGAIMNGQVSVKDTNKVIPSGATVTGVFDESEDDSTGGGSLVMHFSQDFHGLRAPTALSNSDISFDDTGISAAAAASSDESAGCTGGIGIPTAPPGKVCIYLFVGHVTDGTATADALGSGTGFNQADDKGFRVSAGGPPTPEIAGTWAYHAP